MATNRQRLRGDGYNSRSDVYAEERTLPLERVLGKGTKLRDLGHFSAIPFSSISTSLCRECL